MSEQLPNDYRRISALQTKGVFAVNCLVMGDTIVVGFLIIEDESQSGEKVILVNNQVPHDDKYIVTLPPGGKIYSYAQDGIVKINLLDIIPSGVDEFKFMEANRYFN